MILCPNCKTRTRVIDSRLEDGTIRRRRKCESCDHRFWTWEVLDPNPRVQVLNPNVTEELNDLKVQLINAKQRINFWKRKSRMTDQDKALARLRRKLKEAGLDPNLATN